MRIERHTKKNSFIPKYLLLLFIVIMISWPSSPTLGARSAQVHQTPFSSKSVKVQSSKMNFTKTLGSDFSNKDVVKHNFPSQVGIALFGQFDRCGVCFAVDRAVSAAERLHTQQW